MRGLQRRRELECRHERSRHARPAASRRPRRVHEARRRRIGARGVAGRWRSAPTKAKNDALEASAAALRRDSALLLARQRAATSSAARAARHGCGVHRPADADRTRHRRDGAGARARSPQLPDPVGEISRLDYRPSGIQVGMMRVPLGVIGIIYESRPNVTADAAALCLKSGNAAILRGGSEAIDSNRAIAGCMHEGLRAAGLPERRGAARRHDRPCRGGSPESRRPARRRHRSARRQDR